MRTEPMTRNSLAENAFSLFPATPLPAQNANRHKKIVKTNPTRPLFAARSVKNKPNQSQFSEEVGDWRRTQGTQ
jgi:hypothetical protein